MTALAKNARYLARTFLGRHRRLYPLLAGVPSFRHRMVRTDTALCIEGFPRSANTFVLHAFLFWNPGTRVAHHLHVPMQIVRAVDRGIPCLVLLRDPVDALASTLVVDTGLRPDVAVDSYIDFYRRTWTLRDRVVVGAFPTAIARPDLLVDAINRRFGTAFAHTPLDASALERVQARVRDANRGQPETLLALPSDLKRRRQETIREQLGGVRGIAEAQDLYERFRALAASR